MKIIKSILNYQLPGTDHRPIASLEANNIELMKQLYVRERL